MKSKILQPIMQLFQLFMKCVLCILIHAHVFSIQINMHTDAGFHEMDACWLFPGGTCSC